MQVGQAKIKRWIIAGLIIGVTLVVAGLMIFLFVQNMNQRQLTGYNPYDEQLSELEKQTPPTEPMQKAIFYGQLGGNYREIGQIDKALSNFLIAQNILRDNNLETQYSFNQSIADMYKLKRDNTQEKAYLEKQLVYLRQLQQTGYDDGGMVVESIKGLEDRIKGL